MIYDYSCCHCEHEWQEEQRITDPVRTTCPSCGEEAAKRLISSSGAFVLKGNGWAKDGYS